MRKRTYAKVTGRAKEDKLSGENKQKGKFFTTAETTFLSRRKSERSKYKCHSKEWDEYSSLRVGVAASIVNGLYEGSLWRQWQFVDRPWEGAGGGGGVTFGYRSGMKLGGRVSVYTGYRDPVFTTPATPRAFGRGRLGRLRNLSELSIPHLQSTYGRYRCQQMIAQLKFEQLSLYQFNEILNSKLNCAYAGTTPSWNYNFLYILVILKSNLIKIIISRDLQAERKERHITLSWHTNVFIFTRRF